MTIISSTRQTYKNTRSTTDAYFMRIERRDGTVIRMTNAASNITMTQRYSSAGVLSSIGTTVTYYSTGGFSPSANASKEGLSAGDIDFTAILDTTSASTTVSESVQYTPLAANVTASSNHATYDDPTVTVDGQLAYSTPVANGWWRPATTPTHSVPAWLGYDFKIPVTLNRIKYWHGATTYTSIKVSRDGQRWDDVYPMRVLAPGGGGSPASNTLTLPANIRARYWRIYMVSTNPLDVTEVEFFRDTTYTSKGGIAREDVENGLYNNAKVVVFTSNYLAAIEDEEKITRGLITSMTLHDNKCTAEIKSFEDVLKHRTGRKFSPMCDAEFGSFSCGIRINTTTWANTLYATAKATGDMSTPTIIKPTTQNGYYYYASVGGAVALSEPTWPTTPGATVVDGSVTWVCMRAYKLTGNVIDTVTDDRTLTFSEIAGDAANTWAGGILEFTSGALQGVQATIESQTAGVIVLREALRNLPSVNDTCTLTIGCLKRFSQDCITKFGNGINFQGFPYIPGSKNAGKFGGQE